MINEYLFKKYINTLNNKSVFKIFIKDVATKWKLDSENPDILHNIYLHNFMDYSILSTKTSVYTLYDLLFEDLNILWEIHRETENLNFIDVKHGDVFLKMFKYKYEQNNSIYLVKSIESMVCEYCQTQLTYSFSSSRGHIFSGTLDHLIPKTKNSLLAFSCHNLIPSCSTCNSSLKGSKDFVIKKYDHILSDDYFKLKIKKNKIYKISLAILNEDDFEINILYNQGLNDHLKVLRLEDRINYFKRYLARYIHNKVFVSDHLKLNYIGTITSNNLSSNKILTMLYDQITQSDEVSKLLDVVKKAIDRDLANHTYLLY